MDRRGDEPWVVVAKYVLLALIAAKELGVTPPNLDAMKRGTDPDIRRLLGVELGLGKALGLDGDGPSGRCGWRGVMGESFERNLGKGSPIGLERGLNDLWTRGGLIYALPQR